MNNQILEVVDSVSMEKGVDKSIIFEALEEAIASATKKLLGESSEIKVNIDKTTGEYVTFRYWQLSPSEDEDEESGTHNTSSRPTTLPSGVEREDDVESDFVEPEQSIAEIQSTMANIEHNFHGWHDCQCHRR